MNLRELNTMCARLTKLLATKAEHVTKDDSGTAVYITVQQMMTDYILMSGTRLRAKNDAEICKEFLQAMIRTRRHINLKRSFREILGIEVSPTEIKIAQAILDFLTKGNETSEK
jgi:hypothetical protein